MVMGARDTDGILDLPHAVGLERARDAEVAG